MDPEQPSSTKPEPTVLDLFKSATRDWPSLLYFLRTVADARKREEMNAALSAQTAQPPAEEKIVEPPRTDGFPWRSLLAVCMALAAQAVVEPPNRLGTLSFALYCMAAAVAVWAYFMNEWHLPSLPVLRQGVDPLSVRLFPMVFGGIVALLAFFDFASGKFTTINTLLWVLSIGLLGYSLWLPSPRLPQDVSSPRSSSWIRTGLLIVFFGVTIFFRFYKTDSVPVEPFSDHAEKILDVYEITLGNTFVFFERNTGREAFQMYWTLLTGYVFQTGFSFLSLKLGTALLGFFTVPYVYFLAKEYGNERTALLALFLFGIAAWPNIISRVGLRFPLYPLFLAPTFYHLIHGLRTRNRNDFIAAGLFLGIGLHGYSPFRIVPIFVVAAFLLYFLHLRSYESRRQAFGWLLIVVTVSVFVFVPLMRYWISHPEMFGYRAFSRLGDVETSLPGPAWQIFLSNLYKGMLMFNWDDGEIWVHSVTHRPALDVVTAALFVLGMVLLIARYLRQRDWRDLLLLGSVPFLILPSVLSLAFPGENPALNRAGGGAIPAVLVSALALEGFVSGFGVERKRQWIAYAATAALLALSAYSNYDIVFRQFADAYAASSWNTSEMGKVIRDFEEQHGQTDSVWVVPYPYWVDTRLPGVWAGIPNRDFALFPEQLSESLDVPAPKMFIYWHEDLNTELILKELYPGGTISRFASAVEGKDFFIFMVEE